MLFAARGTKPKSLSLIQTPHKLQQPLRSRSFKFSRTFWNGTKNPTRTTSPPTGMDSPRTSIEDFQDLIRSSNRIVALCGAGLSAASGLPTFRGAGGLWRNHEPTSLATPEAFKEDPALVWLFYAWRRHMCLQAEPNEGHRALAALANKKDNFMCLTQNVDGESRRLAPREKTGHVDPYTNKYPGLSIRAGHPPDRLRLLHGSILDLKCFDECGYVERDNLSDPLCPALAAASAVTTAPDNAGRLPLLDPSVPVPQIDIKDLPHCPSCKAGLLRPGVVWFGEALDDDMLRETDAWIDSGPVDVMLVVGTAAVVWPAAGYTEKAERMGAVVAVVNPDEESSAGLGPEDFFFQGDAAEILPRLFAKVI
jgi:NAD+-dependent protein deacetylase sirtuin 5